MASIAWLDTHCERFWTAVGGDFKKFSTLTRFIGKRTEWQDRANCLRVIGTDLSDTALDVSNPGALDLHPKEAVWWWKNVGEHGKESLHRRSAAHVAAARLNRPMPPAP